MATKTCRLCGGGVNWRGQCQLERETRQRSIGKKVAALLMLALLPLLTG